MEEYKFSTTQEISDYLLNIFTDDDRNMAISDYIAIIKELIRFNLVDRSMALDFINILQKNVYNYLHLNISDIHKNGIGYYKIVCQSNNCMSLKINIIQGISFSFFQYDDTLLNVDYTFKLLITNNVDTKKLELFMNRYANSIRSITYTFIGAPPRIKIIMVLVKYDYIKITMVDFSSSKICISLDDYIPCCNIDKLLTIRQIVESKTFGPLVSINDKSRRILYPEFIKHV